MDPQACLERIFDAMRDNDAQEFRSAFEDLYEWLKSGGFAPKLASLTDACGPARVAVGYPGMSLNSLPRYKNRPRKIVSSDPSLDVDCTSQNHFAIMTADHTNESRNGPYVFVAYDFRGDREIGRFQFPVA